MKRLIALFSGLLMLIVLSISAGAAEKPDIVHHTAQYLDRALHVTLQWQSVNPVTLVRVSAGREAKEVKVDEYDNRRVPGGYSGEVTVNIPVEATLNQKDLPYILQLEDDLRLKSELVTGKAPLPSSGSQFAQPYGQPYGQPGAGNETWGQDHLKPTPKSQGGSGDIIEKLVELKDKFDLAPSITQIKANVTGPNNVTFSMKANDDKQLREINIKIFDTQGNQVQTQQITGLGKVWEGTSQVFNISGGTYRATAQAVDMTGNTSKEVATSFALKGGAIGDIQQPVTTPEIPYVEQPPVTTPVTVPDTPVIPSVPVVEQPPVTTPPTTPVTPVIPATPVVVQPPVVTPPSDISCLKGQTLCSGQCVDLTSNDKNCGACGKTCVAPQTCVKGVCKLVCSSGLTNCANNCVDLRSDEHNCGACGHICLKGQSCIDGVCKTPVTPIPITHPAVPVGEMLQNGDFSKGESSWTFETWYQKASAAGEVNFGQPRVTFQAFKGNSRVGIMQSVEKDVSSCRTLMLKAVVRADQQTLSGTGYGGREAPISVFAGYQDINGVERTQNGSLANPVEPQNRQLFWNGFFYMEPTGLSTAARGTRVRQGQWFSYVIDLMSQNPRPKVIRFVGAEGAGWPKRSGALHQLSLVCNGDSTPLSLVGTPSVGQTTGDGMQLLKPPSDPVIYTNGNIAAVNNSPRNPTTFSITSPYKVTWIYTYHYFNGGKLPGTISLRHSDGTVYGPFKTEGAVGQGNVPNAYWFVRPNIEIKAGSYTVIDSDPATWSHNSGSDYRGFVELRGIKGITATTTGDGMQLLRPPSDPVIYTNGNIAAVNNSPRNPTTFNITSPYKVTWIYTYHYFNGGKLPGTISLRHSDGTIYGPFKTEGAVGQGNVPNAYWFVRPNIEIKAGSYTVIDSDPATWSHNSGSDYGGFVELRGIRGFDYLRPHPSEGVWDTSEGVLTFTQIGSVVRGSYSQDNGKIDGTMNANVLDGYWVENSSNQRCSSAYNGSYYWGRIHFVFSGNTFSGAWGYCTANPDHPWTGKKR